MAESESRSSRQDTLRRSALRVAAGYRLGTITSQEIQDFAESCMHAGMYSTAIDEVASSAYPIMSEVGPALEVILCDMDVDRPTRESAVWLLLRDRVGEIASGDVGPREGMQHVVRLYHDANLRDLTKTKQYVGDSHDLQRLLGNYYAFDDVFHASDVEALGAEIVREAVAWMSTQRDGEPHATDAH